MAVTFDVALPATPVFVDPTGRRVRLGRRLLLGMFVMALVFLIGLVVATVVIGQPNDCSLTASPHSATTTASGCRP